MKVLRDEAASATDLQAIDGVRHVLAQLTPAGRRKLLALVARLCLEDADWSEVPLFNDAGRSFAYVMALPHPDHAFDAELTPAVAADIVRGMLTPENARPWREVLAQLEAEDARTSEAVQPATPAAQ
jgi:hypothetical protein